MPSYIDQSAEIKETKLGEDIKVYKCSSVVNSTLSNRSSVGDYSIVRSSFLDEAAEVGRRSKIINCTIGKGTYCGEDCVFKYANFGKYCALSWKISVGGANHDLEKISITPLHRIFGGKDEGFASWEDDKINIGNDVWIAAGAHILRGVSVGDGAVVAANAVVTKDVPPYAVVAGVPAKIIKYRFSKEIIDELLKIKWWDWPEERLMKAKPLFEKELTIEVVKQLKEIL